MAMGDCFVRSVPFTPARSRSWVKFGTRTGLGDAGPVRSALFDPWYGNWWNIGIASPIETSKSLAISARELPAIIFRGYRQLVNTGTGCELLGDSASNRDVPCGNQRLKTLEKGIDRREEVPLWKLQLSPLPLIHDTKCFSSSTRRNRHRFG
jgi:hypothetical protein